MIKTLQLIEKSLERSIEELIEFVRIPSISAGANRDEPVEIEKAADFLVNQFTRSNFTADKIGMGASTNPIVIARGPQFSSNKPTVLFYGHYDVQGVDNPREAWLNDPFEGHMLDGQLIARGASDNKGPTFANVKAAELTLKSTNELPYNIVFVIEGEEECGSGALEAFIKGGGLNEYGPFICTVISDTSMYGPNQPSLTIGLRGISYMELSITGPSQDVHSGLFGGIIHNPNTVLIHALANLIDESGRITVPGFYDGIIDISDREKELYVSLSPDEDAYCRELGVSALRRSPDFTLLEQRWTRPTLDINYISGGSPRTVIPADAKGAISARLVPGQDPLRIENLLKDQIRKAIPAGTTLAFSKEHKSPAYFLTESHPLVQPALEAIRKGFNTEPILTREGGSIPIVTDIATYTQAPVLLVGFGQITDNWHGPNEKFSLEDFHRGMRTSAALLHELKQYTTSSPLKNGS